MKRIPVFFLSLCLILAGCGLTELPAESREAPSLPVPEPPAVLWPSELTQAPEDEAVPVLLPPEQAGEPVRIQGPAGTVEAMCDDVCPEPVWGDPDGDGQTELLYRLPAPTSGVIVDHIYVYGLEEGWPVLESSASFYLQGLRDPRLEQTEAGPVYRCVKAQPLHVQRTEEELRLPLTVREGRLLLNDGQMPEGITGFQSGVPMGFGCSFRALGDSLRGSGPLPDTVLDRSLLLDSPGCLIWRERLDLTEADAAQEDVGLFTHAAVSDNGVTVTGVLTLSPLGSSIQLVSLRGNLLSIPPVEDPEALVGKTTEALIAELGEPHFQLGGGFNSPCWFTQDGKLLAVLGEERVSWAAQTELRTEAPLFAELGENTVIHRDSGPTTLLNPQAWDRFLEAADRGEAAQTRLTLVYAEGVFPVSLRHDGSLFSVDDGARVQRYSYLIRDPDETPPPGAQWSRAVHYLLSDDAEMSYSRYLGHMFSSTVQPDFPAVTMLFSVYE